METPLGDTAPCNAFLESSLRVMLHLNWLTFFQIFAVKWGKQSNSGHRSIWRPLETSPLKGDKAHPRHSSIITQNFTTTRFTAAEICVPGQKTHSKLNIRPYSIWRVITQPCRSCCSIISAIKIITMLLALDYFGLTHEYIGLFYIQAQIAVTQTTFCCTIHTERTGERLRQNSVVARLIIVFVVPLYYASASIGGRSVHCTRSVRLSVCLVLACRPNCRSQMWWKCSSSKV